MASGSEEVSAAGAAPEVFSVAVTGDCGSDSPDCRRSARNSLRSPYARGKRAKSSPKSPLMRMAEIRKGGLKGRVLRQSGKKGFSDSGSKVGRGLRGGSRRGASGLVAILECSELGEGVLGGLEVEGHAGGEVEEGAPGVDSAVVIFDSGVSLSGVGSGLGMPEISVAEGVVVEVGGYPGGVDVVMSDDRVSGESESLVAEGRSCRGSGEGCSKLAGQAEVFPAGLHSDLMLDLVASQPLQEMSFIGKLDPSEVGMLEGDGVSKMLEDFPILSKDNLTAAKDKERNRGGGEKEVPR